MRYMLLVYADENVWTDSERQACYEESAALCRNLAEEGRFIAANPLHPVATATTVRVREGRRMVTDGPFAETREQLGGYYIVDAPDLDAALAIAARIPGAKKGSIEVRPVLEIAGIPQ